MFSWKAIRSLSDKRDGSRDTIRGSAICDVVKKVGRNDAAFSSCLLLTEVGTSRTAWPCGV